MSANLEIKAEARPSGSKLDLIHAAVGAISRYGLSELTSARIASAAGHTAASINFHFGSKEALLLATLREVSEEYAELMASTLAASVDDPLQSLLGIVDLSLSPRLSDAHRIAVWYAFLAESGARADYQRICGVRDQTYIGNLTQLCTRLIDAHGTARCPTQPRWRADWPVSWTSTGRAYCSRVSGLIARPRGASAAITCAVCFRGSRRASRRAHRSRLRRPRAASRACTTRYQRGSTTTKSSTSSSGRSCSCHPGSWPAMSAN